MSSPHRPARDVPAGDARVFNPQYREPLFALIDGMAESFVKTFKRDYVYVNELHDAASVMRQLGGWFEDYNEVHPHKGLRMQSPREYRRATANA